MCVGLWGRDAARGALRGARVPLTVRGLLTVQVECVNVKGHGGHVHVCWGVGGRRGGRVGRTEAGGRCIEKDQKYKKRGGGEEKEEREGGRMEESLGECNTREEMVKG